MEIRTPRTIDERTGIGGIVIVHGIQQEPATRYYAYDMACPVEAPGVSVISRYTGPDHEGLILYRCPSCGSVYELALGIGNPVSGTARHPLRQYPIVMSDNTLRIFNDRR